MVGAAKVRINYLNAAENFCFFMRRRLGTGVGYAGGFARMLASFGKCTRLNYGELRAPDYSQIVLRQFETTSDTLVTGFKHKPNVIQFTCRQEQQFKKEIEVAESGKIKNTGSEERENGRDRLLKKRIMLLILHYIKRWNIARFIIFFTATYCFT